MSKSALSPSRCAAALTLLVALSAAGCTPGIHWRDYTYAPVREAAERDKKITFVYFRSWAVIECTRFEEKVLKDPPVRSATMDLYCVALDIGFDRALAQRWQISEAPAVVLIAPNGTVLSRLVGVISKEMLLDAIKSARAQTTPNEPRP